MRAIFCKISAKGDVAYLLFVISMSTVEESVVVSKEPVSKVATFTSQQSVRTSPSAIFACECTLQI